MGQIATYPQVSNVAAGDLILGTRIADGATVNLPFNVLSAACRSATVAWLVESAPALANPADLANRVFGADSTGFGSYTLAQLAAIFGGGGVQSVVAGTNVTVDNTDPLNPIVSATGGGGMAEAEWPLIGDSTPLVLTYTPVTGYFEGMEAGNVTDDTVTAEAATFDGYDYIGAYAGALGALPEGKSYFWLNLTDGAASEASPCFTIGNHAVVEESSGASDERAPFVLIAIGNPRKWYALVEGGGWYIAPFVSGQPVLVEVDTKAKTCTVKAEGAVSVTVDCPMIGGKSMFLSIVARSATEGALVSCRFSSADAMGSSLVADTGFVPLLNYQAQLPAGVAAPALLTVTGEIPVNYGGAWYCADYSGAYDPATMASEALLWNDEGRVLPLPRQRALDGILSIVPGDNVTVDDTDPAFPVISFEPNIFDGEAVVNVPADFPTLDDALEYFGGDVDSLIGTGGYRVTIEVDETETIGQINVGWRDWSHISIKGLGLGPTINGAGWTPDPLYGAPFWLTLSPGAKLGPVVGAFRSANVAGAAILSNLGGETSFGQITEPLTIAGTFAAGIITAGVATHVAYGATHSSVTSALNASSGSRVVSSGGAYVGGVTIRGDFESSEDNITHGLGTDAVSVVSSGTARLGSSALVGALNVAEGGKVSGKVASITEPAAGFGAFIYADGSDVSIYAEGIEPRVGSAANLVSALSARVSLSGAAAPANASAGFAVQVFGASFVAVGISGAVASFTGGYSQPALTPTANGLILG